eukprot:3856965-Amphidinium_carterae.1
MRQQRLVVCTVVKVSEVPRCSTSPAPFQNPLGRMLPGTMCHPLHTWSGGLQQCLGLREPLRITTPGVNDFLPLPVPPQLMAHQLYREGEGAGQGWNKRILFELRGVSNLNLIAVTGPAGEGKSTLLSAMTRVAGRIPGPQGLDHGSKGISAHMVVECGEDRSRWQGTTSLCLLIVSARPSSSCTGTCASKQGPPSSWQIPYGRS